MDIKAAHINKKRRYEKKLQKRLQYYEEDIKKLLRQEWKCIEKQAKKEEVVRKTKEGVARAGKLLFQLLFVGGVCGIALVAPNVFVAFDKMSRQRVFLKKKDLERGMRSLRSQGDIVLRKVGEHEYEATITGRGRKKSLKVAFQEIGKAKEKEWDGWWRIVIFDIPETHKREREGLREKLESMGFYQLQKSVYVSPYNCERVVEITVSVFEIERYVRIVKTKHIFGDEDLRRHFEI